MKKYKVLRAWEGVEVGDELKTYKDGFVRYSGPLITPLDVALALHLGFIEEVGAVKKERFVPKKGKKYWFLTDDVKPCPSSYYGDEIDKTRIKIRNCYRTEAEALEARERVLKAY